MKKSLKILVPTDFSAPAENALHYGILLADQLGASIDLLNVVFPEGESIDYPVLLARAAQTKIETTRGRLKKLVEKSVSAFADRINSRPMLETGIEVGTPINGICAFAKREEVDLILIGSRGENRSKLEKWMGSVAKGVVEQSPCPVLVIPEQAKFKGVESLTYATDINDADPFEIWKTLQFLKPYQPSVNLVHVNLKKNGNLKAWDKLEDIKAFFGEQPASKINIFHVPGTDPRVEIKNFVAEHPTDLLVMYQSHHGFWDRLFFKSNTKDMVNYTDVPLLVQKSDQ